MAFASHSEPCCVDVGFYFQLTELGTPMPTIHEIVENLESEIAENDETITRKRTEIESYLDNAAAHGESRLSHADDVRSDALYADIERKRAANRRLEARLVRAREVQAEEREQESRLNVRIPTNAGSASRVPNRTTSVRIGSEPHTYRSPSEAPRNPDGTSAEPTFLVDLYRAQVLNDPASMARLQRHGEEMTVDNPMVVQRAVSTGGVPGFIPPAYLASEFAQFARAGRPLADLCTKLPLPPQGMTVNIPRVTTPTATGVQATEGTALTTQDPASTLLTVNVNTIGGYVTVSRQALDRGALTEEVITADLAADYNARLDTQCVNGSGSSGQHLGVLNVSGVNAVTWTQATPDLTSATGGWPKLADSVGKVASQRFTGATAMVMTPSEWVWMCAQKDTTNNRPLITPTGVAQNPMGTMTDSGFQYGQAAGYLFGVPVVLDGNVPVNLGAGTNETRVVAAAFPDLYLFEDNNGAPSQLRFESPSAANLQVLLVAFGYSAFAAGRQTKAISVVRQRSRSAS